MTQNLSSKAFFTTVVLSDLVGLVLIFNVVHFIRVGEYFPLGSISFWSVFGVTILVLYVMDVYRNDEEAHVANYLARTLVGVLISGVIIATVIYTVGHKERSPLFWRGVLPIALVIFSFWSLSTRAAILKWARKKRSKESWLCIGSGEKAKQFVDDYVTRSKYGTLHMLWLDGDVEIEKSKLVTVGKIADLEASLRKEWTGIILATDRVLEKGQVEALMHARMNGVRVINLDGFYESKWAKVPVLHLTDGWFVFSPGFTLLHELAGMRAKRVLDVLAASVFLVFLFPLMVTVACLVKLSSTGPAIYKQERTGENGRKFWLYKFRSMRTDAEKDGAEWTRHNDPRVTMLGNALRKTRIDELPQLWNVLKGEMSFIGPRPERPEFTDRLEKEIPYYDLRHSVKPGITGWAQVMHRYGSSIKDAKNKLEYDLYYIKNYSLLLDLVIFLKTIRVVLFGKGR